ncbi:hypothetical protein PVNG_02175 [Plasmodium vivax North Korean]|uniref:Variable surface protein n=1 Tax=Plasmodium vivax North Korean TaxID=1035514 RepID=A0A0J9TWS6_PLAVI|nr:hypothetical protein PVNG_02175 [Plasmodium vivax North Korean]
MSSEDENQDILNSCDNDSTFNSKPTIEQKNTCKKLLRNLLLCNDSNSVEFMKCCRNLYVWLYFEIKNYTLSNDIIQNIFKLPNLRIKQVARPKYCPYFSFNDNLHKPGELIKLRIFNDNIDKFHNLLNNTDDSKNCFFKRYFYECVNTYIDLNGQFCSEGRKYSTNNKDTCDILSEFSTLYPSFLQKANIKGYELPTLFSSNSYDVVSCTSEETNQESSSTAANNSDKSIQHSVPTAIVRKLLTFLAFYIIKSTSYEQSTKYFISNLKYIIYFTKVWTTYEAFDENVEDYKNSYDTLCDFILKENSMELRKYKGFCMKLMRNLGRYSLDPKFYEPTRERCNILYNWIYNSIGKKTTDDVVNKCFKEYTDNMEYVTNEKKCSKHSYDEKFEEPIKITLLDIFNNNTPDIINTLINEDDSISTPGQKFVCECVRIYKYMDESYCLKNRQKSEKNKTTCLKLDQFKDSYGYFLINLQDSKHKIPLLNDIDNELRVKCPQDRSNLQLTHVEGQDAVPHLAKRRLPIAGHTGSTLEDGLSTPLESTDNSMNKNITTTIGTVAGASSLLAFLYRVITKYYKDI